MNQNLSSEQYIEIMKDAFLHGEKENHFLALYWMFEKARFSHKKYGDGYILELGASSDKVGLAMDNRLKNGFTNENEKEHNEDLAFYLEVCNKGESK